MMGAEHTDIQTSSKGKSARESSQTAAAAHLAGM